MTPSAGRLPAVHRALGEVRPAVDPELDERARRRSAARSARARSASRRHAGRRSSPRRRRARSARAAPRDPRRALSAGSSAVHRATSADRIKAESETCHFSLFSPDASRRPPRPLGETRPARSPAPQEDSEGRDADELAAVASRSCASSMCGRATLVPLSPHALQLKRHSTNWPVASSCCQPLSLRDPLGSSARARNRPVRSVTVRPWMC